MAMATQQHYLVEIDGKLQTIEAGVSERTEKLRCFVHRSASTRVKARAIGV